MAPIRSVRDLDQGSESASPERYRDLAEEYRCLAADTLSGQMKRRHFLMAKDYTLLADVEEQAHPSCNRRSLQKMPSTTGPVVGQRGR